MTERHNRRVLLRRDLQARADYFANLLLNRCTVAYPALNQSIYLNMNFQLLAGAIFLGLFVLWPTESASQAKAVPANTVLFKVDVLKNGKKIKTEQVTAAGARETYANIKKVVQQNGIVSAREWKRQGYNMTAVARCGFLLEAFVVLQGIKEGNLDSTPAVETTANNIIVGLSEVNEEASVACERAGS